MPVIVVNKPFGLRISSKAEQRIFGVGRHTVSDAELAHWFMQACLSDGRADLVAETDTDVAGAGDEPATPTRKKLTKAGRDAPVQKAE